jgi:hypothetical protein
VDEVNVAQSSCRFPCHLSFCQYVKFISHIQCFAIPSTSHKNIKFAFPPPPPLPCFVPFLTSMPDEKGGGEASCNGILSVSIKDVFYRVIKKPPYLRKMVRLCAAYGHHYTDSTFRCVSPTHGKIALTRLALCAHLYL